VLGDEGRDCVMIEADRAIVPLTSFFNSGLPP
jgi:hypothetical protein